MLAYIHIGRAVPNQVEDISVKVGVSNRYLGDRPSNRCTFFYDGNVYAFKFNTTDVRALAGGWDAGRREKSVPAIPVAVHNSRTPVKTSLSPAAGLSPAYPSLVCHPATGSLPRVRIPPPLCALVPVSWCGQGFDAFDTKYEAASFENTHGVKYTEANKKKVFGHEGAAEWVRYPGLGAGLQTLHTLCPRVCAGLTSDALPAPAPVTRAALGSACWCPPAFRHLPAFCLRPTPHSRDSLAHNRVP